MMSDFIFERESTFQLPSWRAVAVGGLKDAVRGK